VLPRYAIHGVRLEAEPARESADRRYTLDARLKPADSGPQSAGGLSLKATLAPAGTAATCSAGGSIFSDSFE
jgi:hypothetical protein